MAVFYADTTTKYDLNTNALNNASKGLTEKAGGFINSIYTGVTGVLRTILPFGELMGLKNERLASEQNSNITADQQAAQADQKTIIAVVVVVVVVAIVFVIIKKKKS